MDAGLQAIQTMPREQAIKFLEYEQDFSTVQSEDIYDAAESLKKTQKIR